MRVCVTLLIFLGKSLFTLNLNSISTGFSLRFTAISTSQNTFNERVLNLSTLLSLYPIYHLPVFFRNCLERFSWIWRSMASTEPTSLHLFRGNYDIITLCSSKLFMLRQQLFSITEPFDRLLCVTLVVTRRLLLSRGSILYNDFYTCFLIFRCS